MLRGIYTVANAASLFEEFTEMGRQVSCGRRAAARRTEDPPALDDVEMRKVMESLMGAAIAVLGTLLGSVATYAFQRRQADRAHRITLNERVRQERLATFAKFAGAATDLRRAAYDQWHRGQEGLGPKFVASRDEYYRIYTKARNLQLRLRLLVDDSELVGLAHQAVECAADIKDAETEQDCAARGDQAKRALDAFVSAAAAELHQET